MRKYERECLQKHPPDEFPVEFVRCVLNHAKEKAKDKELILKATRALVELSRKKGPNDFITLKEIQQHSETAPRVGLWVWLDKEADVVEQRNGPRAYRIKSAFYAAMLTLFPTDVLTANRPGLLSLQGLGKEVWAGIDAQAYVDRERSAWVG